MMDRAIKAIETEYKGYRFRSRLEARWAVFFDHLLVKYEYEAQGFDLGDGILYLPDFWLPRRLCWIEIKGQEPTEEEKDKATRLGKLSGHPVHIFAGEISLPTVFSTTRNEARFLVKEGMLSHLGYGWASCPKCGVVNLAPFGKARYLPCGCGKEFTERFPKPEMLESFKNLDEFDFREAVAWEAYFASIVAHDSLIVPSELITDAYKAARSARFEFGQSGA